MERNEGGGIRDSAAKTLRQQKMHCHQGWGREMLLPKCKTQNAKRAKPSWDSIFPNDDLAAILIGRQKLGNIVWNQEICGQWKEKKEKSEKRLSKCRNGKCNRRFSLQGWQRRHSSKSCKTRSCRRRRKQPYKRVEGLKSKRMGGKNRRKAKIHRVYQRKIGEWNIVLNSLIEVAMQQRAKTWRICR